MVLGLFNCPLFLDPPRWDPVPVQGTRLWAGPPGPVVMPGVGGLAVWPGVAEGWLGGRRQQLEDG